MCLDQQTLAIFLIHCPGLLQQLSDFCPQCLIHQISAELLVPAQAHTPETVGIRADTAIIRITAWIAFSRAWTNGLPIVSIPATRTDKQPLQQIASTSLSNTGAVLAFVQLC